MSSETITGEEQLESLNKGTGCAVVLALPFGGFGLFAAFMMLQQVVGWVETRNWVEYPAIIRDAHLQEDHGSEGGTTYSVTATYEYRVNGKDYTGSRVWLAGGSDNIGDFHQEIYRAIYEHWNQKRPFRCFVDSDDPSRSILFRQMRWGLLAFESLFVLIFGGVAVAIIWGLFYYRKKTRHAAIRSEEYPNEPWKWDESLNGGRYQPNSQWILVVLGALIANVIGWGVLWFAWDSIQEDRSMAWLGLIPLAAILTLIQATRSIQGRVTYGTPELEVTPWPLRVGDVATLRIEGNTSLPEGHDLLVNLKITQETKDSESWNTLKEVEQTATVDGDGQWECQLRLPDEVPRSSAILDTNSYRYAKWTVSVSDPGNKSGFKSSYVIKVFDKIQEPDGIEQPISLTSQQHVR